MQKLYVGIDLGGTKVRVATVSEQGEVLEELTNDTNASQGREKVLEMIFNMIDHLKHRNEVLGIGIGVPGPVVNGVMKISTNLIGFKDFDLKSAMETRFNLKTFVDNDANVAGLAEALLGAGKGNEIVYYFTHSTGIGGALVINGKVISGRHGFAGEVGNIIVDLNGTTRNSLNKGAIENLASGLSMYLRYKDQLPIKDAKDLFELARNRDEGALKAIDQMVKELASMMANVAHVVDPDCFVVGGGCTKASDVYFDKLIKAYYERVHEPMRDIAVYRAKLKEPGVIGAALLASSNLR